MDISGLKLASLTPTTFSIFTNIFIHEWTEIQRLDLGMNFPSLFYFFFFTSFFAASVVVAAAAARAFAK